MAHLSIRNLSKTFVDQQVVNDISLEVKAGEFVALLGPSGSGKSTLLRMLAGFENPTSGRIYHADQPLHAEGIHVPPELRKFGMVFQSYALWPHMSVEENIGYPLRVAGIKGDEKRLRIKRALETVQLEPLAKRDPSSLSGGQRQRVALARCLVTEPQVVLLDEPLANLDRHLRATMEEHFRSFHQRTGATMIYVTHDQGEAMSLADTIVVLNQGKIEQTGSAQQIYGSPKNAWLAGFIGSGCVLKVPVVSDQDVLTAEKLQVLLSAKLSECSRQVFIRPQFVVISNDQGLEACVCACVYKGERYEISLKLLNGQKIQSYHQRPLNIGAKTRVFIHQAKLLEDAR